MTTDLQIGYSDPACRFALWRNVLLGVWTDSPTRPRIEGFKAVQRDLLALPDPICGFSIVHVKQLPSLDFDNAMRRDVGALFSALNGRRGATAMLLEGEGLLMAALRTTLSAILMTVRPSYPVKMFTRRDEATWWLAPHMNGGAGPPTTPPALLAAVTEVTRGLI